MIEVKLVEDCIIQILKFHNCCERSSSKFASIYFGSIPVG